MKERILLVDDDELLIDSYELFLESKYNVVKCLSAEKALDLLKVDNNFAVIISDYNMNGLTGVEFLNQVKVLYPSIVKILLTAVKDVKLVLDAVNESNIFRFLIKDEKLDKLETALKDAIEIKSMLRRQEKLQEELQKTYSRLKQDLKSAAKLQQDIQPKPLSFHGFSFNSIYLPSKFLSGDNFNYFHFGDWIVFYVLDVTGHGIPASMMSFTISRILNSDEQPTNPIMKLVDSKYEVRTPSETLSQLNNTFLTKGTDSQFFAMNYGVICLKEYNITVANAANRKPLLLNDEGLKELDLKGLPIGFLENSKYLEESLKVTSGDKLILYTDGIVDLQNQEGEMFGEKRFFEILASQKSEDISTIREVLEEEIRNWNEKEEHNDDITVLFIQKN